jgi:hypothetical protein
VPESNASIIKRLNGRQLRAVVNGLSEISRDALANIYSDDQEACTELRRIDNTTAASLLKDLMPTLRVENLQLTDEDLRQVLLILDEYPEFKSCIQSALERRLLVSSIFDPNIMGPLLVFLFSIKWKFRVRTAKSGKVDFEFEASKNATPVSLLRSLLSRIPKFGGPSAQAAE